MLGRLQLESFFRINGITNDTSLEEKRELLIQAQWSTNEIESALNQEVTINPIPAKALTSLQQQSISSGTLLKTDTKLKPDSVSSLLGIDINVHRSKLNTQGKRIKDGFTFLQMVTIGTLSVGSALFFVGVAMWYLEMGFFHVAFIYISKS